MWHIRPGALTLFVTYTWHTSCAIATNVTYTWHTYGKRVSDMPHICSPLSVVESSSGKKRLVLTLDTLSDFVETKL